MYQPNFCAECGARIARSRWHLWTSRRFCHDCAPRMRAARILLPLLAGAILFSLGLGAGRAVRPDTPPLVIQRSQLSTAPSQTTQTTPQPASLQTTNTRAPASPEAKPATALIGRPVDAQDETVSICGALTKKGMPCQRRVRGTGRCWQHQGQPAAIPLAERIVKAK